jgi:DNA repair ATPase RecN
MEKIVKFLFKILLFVGVVGGFAKEGGIVTAPQVKNISQKLSKADAIKLIDIAGRQRMLSQRIAKDYLYMGKNIAFDKAQKQLKESLREFRKNQGELSEMINDPELKNLIDFVNMSLDELEKVIKKPFSLDNAQLVLDLSESMLEGSQYIVDNVKSAINVDESKMVAKSGKQRMLSQRIAKYYIAYQAGIKDKNTVEQMQNAVKDFSNNHKELLKNTKNNPTINRNLEKVDKLWKIVYKFYLNIEKGGLPFIVYTSTDDITRMMNGVKKMYVKVYKK